MASEIGNSNPVNFSSLLFSYLFQEFDDYRDADDAVYDLNGKELLGDRYRYFPNDL